MEKEFYKSKTCGGAILILVAGLLELYGVTGGLLFVQNVAGVLGIPLGLYGLRDAQN